MTHTPRHVLPVIVLAQFAGTSLWFAINAVMPDLQRQMGWAASDVGRLTSALQLGFIAGTLVFAVLTIADRSARAIFSSGLFWPHVGALHAVGFGAADIGNAV